MAHFYGTIQGPRGTTSRLGHRDLRVTAQSFEGDIVINLERTAEGDKVDLIVRAHNRTHHILLYSGLIADLLDMEKRAAQMHAPAVQKFLEGAKGDEQ